MLTYKKLPAAPAAEETLPVLAVKPAGFAGTLVAVQCAVTKWDGRIVGAAALSFKGKDALRFEVTRLVEVDREAGLSEAQYALLRRRLGSKSADPDRPNGRHSLVVSQEGPRGLVNLKPWLAAFKQLVTGVNAAREAAESGEQYALLLLVEVDRWELKTPERYPAFREGRIVGVCSAEVVKLD